ncbi:hypothetical protein ACFLRC_04855, partial [Candidatus Altiarchaeota archaeon]
MNVKIKSLVVVFILLGLVTIPATGDVGIDGISVSLDPDNIEVGENFDVEITIEDPDDNRSNVDVDVEIMIEDVIVHEDTVSVDLVEGEDYTITIGSSSFEFDNDDIWRDQLWGYECGDLDIDVTVSGDVDEKDASDSLDIDGEEFEKFTVDPESPSPDDEISIYVEDKDGNEERDVKVVITRLDNNDEWDIDDDMIDDGETDSNGNYEITIEDENEFEDDPYGMFQIDIYKNDYCKESKTIEVSRTLSIAGPFPANPKVGEQFQLRLQDQNGDPIRHGLIVANINRELIKSTTDMDGYARFTINEAGSFSFAVSLEDYDDIIKTVTITELSGMQVSVSPAAPKTGNDVSITVTSGGKGISGATVKITLPDGSSKSQVTGSKGATKFVPIQEGTHSIEVSEASHQS